MMRIVMFQAYGNPSGGFDAPGGGINLYVSQLGEALSRRGHEVYYCSFPYAGAVSGNRHVFIGEPLTMDKRILADCLDELLEPYVSAMRTYMPDVIYSHYWLSGAIHRRAQHRLPDHTWVHTNHSLSVMRGSFGARYEQTFRAGEEERIMGEQGVRLLVQTRPERDMLEPYVHNTPVVIRGGVNTQAFQKRREQGKPCQVLHAGRFEERKGLSFFIDVIGSVNARMDAYYIGGRDIHKYEREFASRIRKRLSRYPANCIRGLPSVSHEHMPDVLAQMDVVVLPSHYEPFGMIALEAQSCGCVTVASQAAGFKETIVHGETGYTLPLDERRFRKALEDLAPDVGLRKSISEAARAHVARHFTWDRVAEVVEVSL